MKISWVMIVGVIANLAWVLIGPAMVVNFLITGTFSISFLHLYLPLILFVTGVSFFCYRYITGRKAWKEIELYLKNQILEKETEVLESKKKMHNLLLAKLENEKSKEEEGRQLFENCSKYFNVRGLDNLNTEEQEWASFYINSIGNKTFKQAHSKFNFETHAN